MFNNSVNFIQVIYLKTLDGILCYVILRQVNSNLAFLLGHDKKYSFHYIEKVFHVMYSRVLNSVTVQAA
jgi:hypothetical protein